MDALVLPSCVFETTLGGRKETEGGGGGLWEKLQSRVGTGCGGAHSRGGVPFCVEPSEHPRPRLCYDPTRRTRAS